MKFTPLEIPDVLLIEPKVFGDGRGYFFESYHQALFRQNGIKENFVQDNQSRSAKGVLRGLHYQIPPKGQAKLIRVLSGSIFDVAVDLRKSSSTFGKVASVVLSGESKKMLYIPEGFAHGFMALEEGTEVLYKVSDFYSPEHERGIIWNDPDLEIKWPSVGIPPLFSEKDVKYPPLKQAVLFS